MNITFDAYLLTSKVYVFSSVSRTGRIQEKRAQLRQLLAFCGINF